MLSPGTILKVLLVEFAKSPLNTLVGLGRRLLPKQDITPQVQRMRTLVRQAPLILQVETINVCNSACVFCAHPKIKREKGVMSMPMFEQIVNEYAAMGGGPVSLTPLGGDALLDPHLLERLRNLSESPQISQISLTTNAIALKKYSDEEVLELLRRLDGIQVSVGGLDAETYRSLFGVDRFDQVMQAVERLLDLKEKVVDPPIVNLAFRTGDWAFELRYRSRLKEYRRRGAFVSHIWTYANFSGLVGSDEQQKLVVIDGAMEKKQTCIYPAIHMAICWDGRITACGCVDFEGTALNIGQIGKMSLGQIWSADKRQAILQSFAAGKLAKICRSCSAYQPDSAIFSQPHCRGIESHQPLPPQFFQQFWGG